MTERVARSGLHIYGQSVVFALGGGLFWILMAALLGPREMGKAAYVVSLASLASTAATLGLDKAVMREQGRNPTSLYTALSLYAGIGGAASIAAAAAAYIELGPIGALSAALLSISQASSLFAAALIAEYKTERLPIYTTASIAARFAVALALLDTGWKAVALGYSAGSLLYLALTAYASTSSAKPRQVKLKEAAGLVKAGLSAWPGQLVGALLMGGGTALTYTSAGQEAAGVYYVAYTAASVVVGLPSAIATAALPYFASTNAGSDALADITAYVGTPFVAAAAAAPSAVLALLGSRYAAGGADLALLSVALWLLATANVYLNKAYAEGRYVRYAAAYVALGAAMVLASRWAPYSVAALAGAAALYATSRAKPALLLRLAPAAAAPLFGLVAPWPLAVTLAFAAALVGASKMTPKEVREVVAAISPRPLRPIVRRLALL